MLMSLALRGMLLSWQTPVATPQTVPASAATICQTGVQQRCMDRHGIARQRCVEAEEALCAMIAAQAQTSPDLIRAFLSDARARIEYLIATEGSEKHLDARLVDYLQIVEQQFQSWTNWRDGSALVEALVDQRGFVEHRRADLREPTQINAVANALSFLANLLATARSNFADGLSSSGLAKMRSQRFTAAADDYEQASRQYHEAASDSLVTNRRYYYEAEAVARKLRADALTASASADPRPTAAREARADACREYAEAGRVLRGTSCVATNALCRMKPDLAQANAICDGQALEARAQIDADAGRVAFERRRFDEAAARYGSAADGFAAAAVRFNDDSGKKSGLRASEGEARARRARALVRAPHANADEGEAAQVAACNENHKAADLLSGVNCTANSGHLCRLRENVEDAKTACVQWPRSYRVAVPLSATLGGAMLVGSVILKVDYDRRCAFNGVSCADLKQGTPDGDKYTLRLHTSYGLLAAGGALAVTSIVLGIVSEAKARRFRAAMRSGVQASLTPALGRGFQGANLQLRF